MFAGVWLTVRQHRFGWWLGAKPGNNPFYEPALNKSKTPCDNTTPNGAAGGMHLTRWGRDKIDAIVQTTFSNTFSWMKIYEFRLRFHRSLFLRVQLTIFHHWFRKWLGAGQATSHYLNQWWLVYWRIYASLGLNELTPMIKNFNGGISRTHFISGFRLIAIFTESECDY